MGYRTRNGKDVFGIEAENTDIYGGDYNMVTVSEVEKLAGGDGSGRIQR